MAVFSLKLCRLRFRLRDWFCRWPVMGFAGRVAAPAVERVIKRDAGLELLEIVIIHPRQAQRSREQAGRFRTEIEPCGSGGAPHGCQPQQRRRRQTELLDHHVERTELAAMAPEHVFDIEGKGAETLAARANPESTA